MHFVENELISSIMEHCYVNDDLQLAKLL